eukprot:5007750-Amphidinium_carterae.2
METTRVRQRLATWKDDIYQHEEQSGQAITMQVKITILLNRLNGQVKKKTPGTTWTEAWTETNATHFAEYTTNLQ